MDRIKQIFLEASVFGGKTFWEVEKDFAWLDESQPSIKEASTEKI